MTEELHEEMTGNGAHAEHKKPRKVLTGPEAIYAIDRILNRTETAAVDGVAAYYLKNLQTRSAAKLDA